MARNAEETIGSERDSGVDSPNIKQFVERALERSANQCRQTGVGCKRRGLSDARGGGTTADSARRRSGKKGCHVVCCALGLGLPGTGQGLDIGQPGPLVPAPCPLPGRSGCASAALWSGVACSGVVPLLVESSESSQSERWMDNMELGKLHFDCWVGESIIDELRS